MSDDGEAELTQDDKRILKYVADAAREEMPSRRGFIQGGTAAAALGALGFGAGSATAQTQAAGQVGTQANPVDVEAASVSTNEQQHTQPSGTYDWQDINYILGQGGVVASNGQVYQGPSAIQDAIDSGAVYILAGKADYSPITIDRYVVIQGVGTDTRVMSQSADTHACEINDPSSGFVVRIQLQGLMLNTSNASGASDALHIESVNGNQIYESWFTNLQLQGGPRHGVYLDAATTTNGIPGMWFTQLFEEGFSGDGIHAADSDVFECSVIGGDINDGIRWGGRRSTFVLQNLGGATFTSASSGNYLLSQGGDTITDNGTDNTIPEIAQFPVGNQLGKGTYGAQPAIGGAESLTGIGSGTYIDAGTANHATQLTGQFSSLESVRVNTTPGGGNAYDAVHCKIGDTSLRGQRVDGVQINGSDRHGLYIGPSTRGVVATNIQSYTARIDDDGLHIDGDGNTIIGWYARGNGTAVIDGNDNQIIGHNLSVTDNGTGNTF